MEYKEVANKVKKKENIYPPIFFAGFFERSIAFLIDLIMARGIERIVINNILRLSGLSLGDRASWIISTAFLLAYFSLMTYFFQGQTLGKMIMGLRVVSLKSNKLEAMDIVTREVFGRFFHLYSFFFIFYGLTGLTDYKQNLSDLMADTSVIKLRTLEAYTMGIIKDHENPHDLSQY